MHTVVVSHFHDDHFGGVPFVLREGQLKGSQDGVVTVVGTEGTFTRLVAASEGMFPGSTRAWENQVKIIENRPDPPYLDDRLAISPCVL